MLAVRFHVPQSSFKLYKSTLAEALLMPESTIQIVDRTVGPADGSTAVHTRILTTLNATLQLTDLLQVPTLTFTQARPRATRRYR